MKRLSLTLFALILSAGSAFAVTDTIHFGGTIGLKYVPLTQTVAVGDTIVWYSDQDFAFSNHPLMTTALPHGADTIGTMLLTSGGLTAYTVDTGNVYMYVVKIAGVYNYQCLYHHGSGMVGTFTATGSSVKSETSPIVSLGVNYPNPSQSNTTITYTLSRSSEVNLSIFDANGKKLLTLMNKQQSAGSYEVPLDAGSLSSGTYTYRLEAGESVLARQMLISH